MEIAKANFTSDRPTIEVGEGSSSNTGEYPNYWSSGIDDLALDIAFERQRENMDLNTNPLQENGLADQEINSIWDFRYE